MNVEGILRVWKVVFCKCHADLYKLSNKNTKNFLGHEVCDTSSYIANSCISKCVAENDVLEDGIVYISFGKCLCFCLFKPWRWLEVHSWHIPERIHPS